MVNNKQNISILQHEDCCGCKACGDVCPVNCISFIEDVEGFEYPHVELTSCISCGKCIRNCPEINTRFNELFTTAYASYALDNNERHAGSSGGVFGLLATEVIKRGGKVWGASFDKDLKLKHNCASTINELKPLMRSKYLQSDTSGCYAHIIGDIKDGKLVLFSGTPCQCNAVQNAAGSNSDNLITIEVVCHGVPSQNLFDRTIAWIERCNNYKINSFSFRSKYKNALHPQAYSYTYTKKGKTKIKNGLHYQNPFYFGFQKYITLRPSCYRCKWARPERCSDITLGDFWGVENYDSSLDAKTGISMVITNTDKGAKLFNQLLRDNKLFVKRVPLSVAIENNGCLSSPTALKPDRQLLFNSLVTESFDKSVHKFLTPRRKWIFDIYYAMPGLLRRTVRKLMDKRMKYE